MWRGRTGSSCRIALTANLLSNINYGSDERMSSFLLSHVRAVRLSQSCCSITCTRSTDITLYRLPNAAANRASSRRHSFNYFGIAAASSVRSVESPLMFHAVITYNVSRHKNKKSARKANQSAQHLNKVTIHIPNSMLHEIPRKRWCPSKLFH